MCRLVLLVMLMYEAQLHQPALELVNGQPTNSTTLTPTPLVPSSLPHPIWACRPITSVPSPFGGYPITFAVGVYHCSSSSPPLNMTRDSSRPMLSLIFLNDIPPGWRTMGYFGMARYTLEQYASQTINMLDTLDGQGGIILFHLNGNCTERAGIDVTYQALTVPGLIPIGIIGSVCTASTSATALVSGNKGIPQISIAAASTSLSDKSRYPTLFRTCATTLDQARMFLSFCQFYGLAVIAVLYSDNASGSTLMDNMNLLRTTETAYQYIKITFIPVPDGSTKDRFTHILINVRDAGHHVFITNVVLNSDVMCNVAASLGMYGTGYIWLSPFGAIGPFLRSDATATSATMIQNMFVASTYINTSHPLTQQVTQWAITVTAPLGESMGENHYYVHDATNVLLNAIYTVLQAHPTCNNYSCAITYLTGNNHMELLNAMSQTQIMSSAGYPFRFTSQGDRSGFAYHITSLHGTQPAHLDSIGLVFGGTYQETNPPIFPGGVNAPPTTLYTRYAYPTSLTTGIWVVAWLTVGICAVLMIMVTIYHNIPIIKASTVPFNYIILLGIAMLAGHALLYVTEVGDGQVSVVSERERQYSVVITQGTISVALWNGGPHHWICHLRVWLTPLSVLLILVPVLLKTIRIAYIFIPKELQISCMSRTAILFVGLFVMLIIQIVFTIILEMINTPTAELIVNSQIWDNNTNTNDYIIKTAGLTYWQCNTTDWFVAITCAYIGFLTIATTLLAIRVRHVPQRFNESTQLLSIALFIGVYSILALPLQFSLSSGNPTTFTDDRITQVATFRAVGLLLGAWVIVAVLYIPKLMVLRQKHDTDIFGQPTKGSSGMTRTGTATVTASKPRTSWSHKSNHQTSGHVMYEKRSISMPKQHTLDGSTYTTSVEAPCRTTTPSLHEQTPPHPPPSHVVESQPESHHTPKSAFVPTQPQSHHNTPQSSFGPPPEADVADDDNMNITWHDCDTV